ncbi:putative membrane protein [Aurantimicrobium minutum]|uniref:vitamin K epoxide reductase family protein n=1 Tax=Aurantimicrobium minutum TaxID=708131 RepID=UPI002475078C|nr:vitamin K epoxide reductase family protein [Aurantimicrobium minutum]MDH6532862.1 putative membrane protein [Aurantimicrobium minutum]
MSIPIAESKRPTGLAFFMLIAGAIGLTAAFALSVEKIHQLQFPDESASCDFGVVVQCGKNLASWQGSLLGFPNPLIGLMGWSVVITLAIALLAGARCAPWFWRGLNIGAAGALGFVLWLFSQSVFVLGTLCPWCMVTWFATIPFFWVITFWNMKHGVWGINAQKLGSLLLSWVGLIILVSFLIEALIAQLVLDWIGTL